VIAEESICNGDGALEVEPSLLPPSRRLLRRFAVPGLDSGYLRHLEERIQRDPRDLHAHVERVLLRESRREGAELFAALVDLFIALGPGGRALRSRLLRRAAPHLATEQRGFLETHLDSPLQADAPGAAVPGACLSRPVAGTTLIVRRRHATGTERIDAAALAREAMASGDESAAQALLEEALEIDPGLPEASLELLALYQRGNQRADFERTRAALLGRRLARPDLWERTAAYFAGQHDSRDAPVTEPSTTNE
jgi:hypothetical protein